MPSTWPYPTAVQDRLDLDLDELKSLLEITGSTQDAILQLRLDSAKEAADNFLNNHFRNAAGEDIPIPSNVKIGVVEYIRENMGLATTAATAVSAGGIKRERRDRIEVEYHAPGASSSSGSSASTPDKLSPAVRGYWLQYRREPGLAARA